MPSLSLERYLKLLKDDYDVHKLLKYGLENNNKIDLYLRHYDSEDDGAGTRIVTSMKLKIIVMMMGILWIVNTQ